MSEQSTSVAPRRGRQETALASIRAAYLTGHLVLVAGTGVTMSSLNSSTKPGASEVAMRMTWPGLLRDGLSYIAPRKDRFTTHQRQRFDLYSEQLRDGQDLDTDSLIATADFLKKRLEDPTQQQLATWLRQFFGTLFVDYIQHEDIKILAAMKRLLVGGARIMTTNYDDIIERYCNTTAILPNQHFGLDDFFQGTADREPAGVLHVHGHWKDSRSAVLDAVSYRDTTSNASLQFALRALFQSPAVLLFIGTGKGMDDPNFGSLLNWARNEFRGAHRHYVLVREGDHLEDETVLSPIYYGKDFTDLPVFLESISGTNVPEAEIAVHEALTTPAPPLGQSVTWLAGSERLLPDVGTSEAPPALAEFEEDLVTIWRGTDFWFLRNHRLYLSRFARDGDGILRRGGISLIHENAHSPDRPGVAAMAGKLVVAWRGVEDQTVYYSTLGPDGLDWSNPVPLPGAGSNYGPALAPWKKDGKTRVYALWKGIDIDQHAHLSWYDGQHWTAPKRLYFVDTDANVSLACTEHGIFISWKASGTSTIFWMRLNDDGTQYFEEPREMGNGVQSNLGPALAAVGDTVYAAWKGIGGSADVSLTSWTGDGDLFRHTQIVPNSNTDRAASLVGWNNWLMLAWKDTNFEKTMSWKHGRTG